MKNRVKRILPFVFYLFILLPVQAQNNLTWEVVNTDKYSIKIPSDWIQEMDLPVRKTEFGLTIDKQVFKTPQIKGKGSLFVDIIKYDHDKGITINDICARDSAGYCSFLNGKLTKQIAAPPCKLHYMITYQYDNPYIKKMEYMNFYAWLYEQGKSVYSINILYEKDAINDFPNISEIIENIQKSFTLK